MSDNAAINTDRELWRNSYDSVHITEGGGIGINNRGRVLVKTPKEWHETDKELEALRAKWGLKEIERHNEEKFKWKANERADKAEETAKLLLIALEKLVADVADYPAWDRPCYTLDFAKETIKKAKQHE